VNRILVGISGGSGSGKTTFLRQLKERIPANDLALVSQDNYYKPQAEQHRDENGWVNYDLPTGINREKFVQDMNLLLRGEAIEFLEYNFNNPAWEPEKVRIEPAKVIVMEGLFVFHFQEIFERLNHKVFISAPEELRLQRRIDRDLGERGYPEHEVRYQWDNHVRPAEKKFLEPYISACDLIIDSTKSFETEIHSLAQTLGYE
jgi:uridine kinase